MDLIRRSLAGDEGAFSELFHQYKNLVYKTAYLILDNPNDAEDVLQEVFVQVHKSLSTYQPSKGAFSTWLYRITINHTSLLESQLAEEEATQQALGQLSEKLRTVLILRYYWELSYAEIVQILDIPVGTVKSRLNLALKTLHKKLEAAAENDPAPRIFHPKRIAE